MEYIPQESVDQQVKALIHTLEKIKQNLTRMTSALDTHEIATFQLVEDTQVTTVADKAEFERTQVEEKLLKELKVQVSSFLTSTIDLINSEEEDEILSPTPITE